jgi:hypothetical protein
MIPAPIQPSWGCKMMPAFTRRVVARLATLLIFPLASLPLAAQAPPTR